MKIKNILYSKNNYYRIFKTRSKCLSAILNAAKPDLIIKQLQSELLITHILAMLTAIKLVFFFVTIFLYKKLARLSKKKTLSLIGLRLKFSSQILFILKN